MKKLIAGVIICVTVLLNSIGISVTAADENIQSEIIFVSTRFYPYSASYNQAERPKSYPESFEGIFIESNGTVRKFSFQDINEDLSFGTVKFPRNTITLTHDTKPQENLLSKLSNVEDFEIIGYVSQQELHDNIEALSNVDTNELIQIDNSPWYQPALRPYVENFGIRNNNEIVFLGGADGICFLPNDENAYKIDNWLRNLNISSQPNPSESTTTISNNFIKHIKGDANSDEKLNILDAAFIAKKVAQRWNKWQILWWADYNKDGFCNILDAAAIAKDIAKRKI